ncbi:MAG TPA: hypothetical protein VF444_13605 [Pseudonocardiaceae bacterium]
MADDSVHTPAQPAHGTTEMLIDRYLPGFDATIIEHVVVNADIPTAWRALCDLDLMRVHTPLLDAAFFVRGVPIRLAGLLGRGTQHPEAPPQLKLSADSVGLEGWLQLGEQPEREIAIGAVGRFWQPNIEWHDVATMTPEQFGGFDEPGWGRIAANWSLRPYGTTRTLASYEARVAVPDAESARAFGRYWRLIRPFVGHIMRATLSTLRDNAERLAR